MSEVTCVVDADNYLGESPIWSASNEVLWWVNCEKPAEIHRWSPEMEQHDVWPMPRRCGGLVPKRDGGLLVVLSDGVYDFNLDSAELTLRAPSPLPDHVKLHECHCDRQGRFWVGAYDHHFPAAPDATEGKWFRLDGDTLTPVIEGIAVANGLAFSPDGRTIYISDSPTRRIEACDLDPETGAISNRRPFVSLSDGEGFVDGATVDAEGYYWLAAVGAGTLRRYAPDGTLNRVVDLPCSNPTKPAFGGPDLATLYVTSTKMKLGPSKPSDAPNGGLFALQPGVKGVAEVGFSG